MEFEVSTEGFILPSIPPPTPLPKFTPLDRLPSYRRVEGTNDLKFIYPDPASAPCHPSAAMIEYSIGVFGDDASERASLLSHYLLPHPHAASSSSSSSTTSSTTTSTSFSDSSTDSLSSAEKEETDTDLTQTPYFTKEGREGEVVWREYQVVHGCVCLRLVEFDSRYMELFEKISDKDWRLSPIISHLDGYVFTYDTSSPSAIEGMNRFFDGIFWGKNDMKVPPIVFVGSNFNKWLQQHPDSDPDYNHLTRYDVPLLKANYWCTNFDPSEDVEVRRDLVRAMLNGKVPSLFWWSDCPEGLYRFQHQFAHFLVDFNDRGPSAFQSKLGLDTLIKTVFDYAIYRATAHIHLNSFANERKRVKKKEYQQAFLLPLVEREKLRDLRWCGDDSADITFLFTQNEPLHRHKFILRERSTSCRLLLERGGEWDTKGPICLHGYSREAFIHLFDKIYTNHSTVSISSAKEANEHLKIAERFGFGEELSQGALMYLEKIPGFEKIKLSITDAGARTEEFLDCLEPFVKAPEEKDPNFFEKLKTAASEVLNSVVSIVTNIGDEEAFRIFRLLEKKGEAIVTALIHVVVSLISNWKSLHPSMKEELSESMGSKVVEFATKVNVTYVTIAALWRSMSSSQKSYVSEQHNERFQMKLMTIALSLARLAECFKTIGLAYRARGDGLSAAMLERTLFKMSASYHRQIIRLRQKGKANIDTPYFDTLFGEELDSADAFFDTESIKNKRQLLPLIVKELADFLTSEVFWRAWYPFWERSSSDVISFLKFLGHSQLGEALDLLRDTFDAQQPASYWSLSMDDSFYSRVNIGEECEWSSDSDLDQLTEYCEAGGYPEDPEEYKELDEEEIEFIEENRDILSRFESEFRTQSTLMEEYLTRRDNEIGQTPSSLWESFGERPCFSDVEFVCCDGGKVLAHRAIIVGLAPAFASLFQLLEKPTVLPVVVLVPQLSTKSLTLLLQYIYGYSSLEFLHVQAFKEPQWLDLYELYVYTRHHSATKSGHLPPLPLRIPLSLPHRTVLSLTHLIFDLLLSNFQDIADLETLRLKRVKKLSHPKEDNDFNQALEKDEKETMVDREEKKEKEHEEDSEEEERAISSYVHAQKGLADEIWGVIFTSLSASELFRLRFVCKSFYRIASKDILWKHAPVAFGLSDCAADISNFAVHLPSQIGRFSSPVVRVNTKDLPISRKKKIVRNLWEFDRRTSVISPTTRKDANTELESQLHLHSLIVDTKSIVRMLMVMRSGSSPFDDFKPPPQPHLLDKGVTTVAISSVFDRNMDTGLSDSLVMDKEKKKKNLSDLPHKDEEKGKEMKKNRETPSKGVKVEDEEDNEGECDWQREEIEGKESLKVICERLVKDSSHYRVEDKLVNVMFWNNHSPGEACVHFRDDRMKYKPPHPRHDSRYTKYVMYICITHNGAYDQSLVDRLVIDSSKFVIFATIETVEVKYHQGIHKLLHLLSFKGVDQDPNPSTLYGGLVKNDSFAALVYPRERVSFKFNVHQCW